VSRTWVRVVQRGKGGQKGESCVRDSYDISVDSGRFRQFTKTRDQKLPGGDDLHGCGDRLY